MYIFKSLRYNHKIFSYKVILSHITFILGFVCIFLVLTPINHLDFYTHNKQLLSFYETGFWRPNFLYYFFVAFLSGFSKNILVLGKISALIMALAIYAKWILTEKVSKSIFYANAHGFGISGLSFLLLFVFSLPATYNNWYFGQISPNQWHNSTTILLMPIAIILFHHSYIYFFEDKNSSKYQVLWLSFISVLIKPSFIFCLVPVVLVLGFFYSENKSGWVNKMGVFMPAILLLLGQYVILYLPHFKSAAILSGEEGGVAFDFLHVWQHYSDNILLSLFLSVAFPIAVMIFYSKEVFKEKYFIFALSLSIMGVLIFACFTETGRRQFHCNFIWQAIVANYLLYMVSIHLFIKSSCKLKNHKQYHVISLFKYYLNERQFKALVVYSLFLLQCVGGLYYLLRMIFRNGSYA